MHKSEQVVSGLKDAVGIKYMCHFRGELKNSIFIDTPGGDRSNNLIYLAANTITFNSLSASFQNQKSQTFIPALPGSLGITCIAQSQNKRYLAWAQQTQTVPLIYLIDLLGDISNTKQSNPNSSTPNLTNPNLNNPSFKKRSFATTQIKSKKITCLTFNGNQITDPKFLVGLTSGPDYQIIQWNFQKGKFFIHSLQKNQKTTSVTTGIAGPEKFNQIFFYREEDTIVAMGKQNFKMFKLTPEKLILKDSPFARKQINQKDYNFTAYCVMKDSLVVGTESGELLYFSANGEFKAVIFGSPGQSNAIETLLYLPNTNKAFLVGGSDKLLMYQRTENKDPKMIYVKSEKKFPFKDHKGRITSLAVTPKQNDIFIGYHTGVLMKMTLQKNEQSTIDSALQSYHTENITGLAICLRKPLVATCSADRSVRVWNYHDKNTTLQVVKQFQEKPLSLCFHPSGQHLVVSFPDKVRLINIQESQLISFKDIPIKNCYEVKFSNGGHLFAAVNNVMVQIFNFYTLDQNPDYQYKVHPGHSGRFQTMTWQQDDLGVYLGTSDGVVYFYKLEDTLIRETILQIHGFEVKTIASIFVAKDQKQGVINERKVYVGGKFLNNLDDESKCIFEVKITPKSQKDKQRESYKEDLVKYNISAPNKIYTYCNVSRIAFLNSRKVFLYAANKKEGGGSIRYCKYPLSTSKQIFQIQGHTKPINKIVVSYDDNCIFSAGQEGELICYEFKDKDSKIKIQMPDFSEFLYSKAKLTLNKNTLQQLRSQNQQAKQKKDRATRQAKAQNQRMHQELNFKINERQKQQKQKYNKEVEQISRMQKEQARVLSNLQIEHRQKRQAVQKDYSDKIHLQQTRFNQLGKTRQSENKKFNQYIQTLKNNHIKAKQRKQVQFKEELAKQKEELLHYQAKYDALKAQYEKAQQILQAQAQKQIKKFKQEHEITIKNLKKENQKAECEKRAKKQSYQKQQRQLQQQNHKLKHTHEDIQKIKQKNEEYFQKKQSQAKEIEQRQKTIRDKMLRINELKKKTQQLQKFKFVLDYKIKQLKRDIGPRQEQISKMKQQIANMNSQISHFQRTNQNMKLIVKDLVSKKNGMDKQADILNENQGKNVGYIKSFQYDISQLYQNCINDYKELKKRVVEFYRKYVQEENKKKMDGIDQQKQFIKQRAHLQSTVKGLKQKFKKSIQLHENDNKRIMSQNQQLISEINDLKRQKKNLKDDSHKQQMMKQVMIKLQEQKIAIDKQFENTDKVLKQKRKQYENKVKLNRRQGLQV